MMRAVMRVTVIRHRLRQVKKGKMRVQALTIFPVAVLVPFAASVRVVRRDPAGLVERENRVAESRGGVLVHIRSRDAKIFYTEGGVFRLGWRRGFGQIADEGPQRQICKIAIDGNGFELYMSQLSNFCREDC